MQYNRCSCTAKAQELWDLPTCFSATLLFIKFCWQWSNLFRSSSNFFSNSTILRNWAEKACQITKKYHLWFEFICWLSDIIKIDSQIPFCRPVAAVPVLPYSTFVASSSQQLLWALFLKIQPENVHMRRSIPAQVPLVPQIVCWIIVLSILRSWNSSLPSMEWNPEHLNQKIIELLETGI